MSPVHGVPSHVQSRVHPAVLMPLGLGLGMARGVSLKHRTESNGEVHSGRDSTSTRTVSVQPGGLDQIKACCPTPAVSGDQLHDAAGFGGGTRPPPLQVPPWGTAGRVTAGSGKHDTQGSRSRESGWTTTVRVSVHPLTEYVTLELPMGSAALCRDHSQSPMSMGLPASRAFHWPHHGVDWASRSTSVSSSRQKCSTEGVMVVAVEHPQGVRTPIRGEISGPLYPPPRPVVQTRLRWARCPDGPASANPGRAQSRLLGQLVEVGPAKMGRRLPAVAAHHVVGQGNGAGRKVFGNQAVACIRQSIAGPPATGRVEGQRNLGLGLTDVPQQEGGRPVGRGGWWCRCTPRP